MVPLVLRESMVALVGMVLQEHLELMVDQVVLVVLVLQEPLV
jgi:hypothetical protein